MRRRGYAQQVLQSSPFGPETIVRNGANRGVAVAVSRLASGRSASVVGTFAEEMIMRGLLPPSGATVAVAAGGDGPGPPVSGWSC